MGHLSLPSLLYTICSLVLLYDLPGGLENIAVAALLDYDVYTPPLFLDMSGAVVIPDATQKSPMYLASIYSF